MRPAGNLHPQPAASLGSRVTALARPPLTCPALAPWEHPHGRDAVPSLLLPQPARAQPGPNSQPVGVEQGRKPQAGSAGRCLGAPARRRRRQAQPHTSLFPPPSLTLHPASFVLCPGHCLCISLRALPHPPCILPSAPHPPRAFAGTGPRHPLGHPLGHPLALPAAPRWAPRQEQWDGEGLSLPSPLSGSLRGARCTQGLTQGSAEAAG